MRAARRRARRNRRGPLPLKCKYNSRPPFALNNYGFTLVSRTPHRPRCARALYTRHTCQEMVPAADHSLMALMAAATRARYKTGHLPRAPLPARRVAFMRQPTLR